MFYLENDTKIIHIIVTTISFYYIYSYLILNAIIAICVNL